MAQRVGFSSSEGRGQARSISQPFLDKAVAVDECQHGYLRHLMTACDAVRQANFGFLSKVDWVKPQIAATEIGRETGREVADGDALAIIGETLMRLPAKAILRVTFGDCPVGFRSFLGRLGPQPIGQDALEAAYAIFSEPGRHGERIRLLQQMQGRIKPSAVIMCLKLDGVLLHPAVIAGIALEEVDGALELFRLVRAYRPDLTDHVLRQSLDAWGRSRASNRRSRSFGEWAMAFIEKSAITRWPVATPLANDPLFRLLSPADVVEAASRYRNCLRDQRFGHLIAGRRCYLEFLGETKAVIELCVLRSRGEVRFALGEIQAVDRSRTVQTEILRRLEANGVLIAGTADHSEFTLRALGIHTITDDFGDWDDHFRELMQDAA